MYVYFIKAGIKDSVRIKIGSSKDPQARLKSLQTGNPDQLKLIGTIKCKSSAHALHIEKLAHAKFYKQRRKGEWFRLSEKHIMELEMMIENAAKEDILQLKNVIPEYDLQNYRIVNRPLDSDAFLSTKLPWDY
jgi:T5orf172 domain